MNSKGTVVPGKTHSAENSISEPFHSLSQTHTNNLNIVERVKHSSKLNTLKTR